MASLLRSGKYFRYFSNAARNLVFNNGNRSDAEAMLCARRDEWEIKIHRSLSSFELPLKYIFSETEPVPANTALDKALGQADEDIRKFGRIPIKTIENILSTVKQLKNATTQQCVLMIHCCGNLASEEHPENRTKLVHEIWNTLEKLQIPLDIKHYNALLRVYLENGHTFDSQEFLTTIVQKEIKPNRVTYQRLVSAYCLKGDLNGASKILEKMKEENLPINEHIFNALITGHARIGDFENAKGMVNIMQQSGLQPDSGTYEALMCGYALAGDLEEVIATNKECNSKSLYMFQRQWLEVLFTAAVNEHNSIVDYVLSQIPRDSGYNSECLNLIYRLINCEKDDIAFKVFLTMKQALKDPKLNTSGASFVRHLVKRNRPVNTIIGFCDEIATKGINPRIYFICLSISNTNGNAELTAALLERIKGQKEEISPRMFWSLLDMQGSKAGEKGILDLLRKLIDIDVNFNAQTISNHVIDHLNDPLNVRSTARKLGSSGVPQHIAHQSLLLKALQRRDFEAACNVVSVYDIYLREEHHIAAAKAYASKNDPESFARLLGTILKNKKVVRKDPKEYAVELYDPFVIEAISIKPSPEEIEKLLSALHKAGVVLSNKAAASVQSKLENSMTNEISELLDKLCAGDSFEYQEPTSRAAEYKELWDAVNDGDVDKALKIRCDLQSKAFVFPRGLSVMFIDLLVKKNKLDEAWVIFNDAVAENSNFHISSPVKCLMFANALLKSDRVDDALLVLSKLHVPKEDRNLNVASLAWRFLNYPAEKGDEELLNKFFDLVSNIPGVPMNSLVLSPLIKIKLNRGDLDAAIQEMENCATNYGVTPLKNQLMVELIQKEDADRLQKVMDTSFKIHGEANSLYDLVFAFLECGRVRQAQKVIETPGLRARKDRLNLVCERYVEEKRVTELDNLVKITKGLFGIDRVGLYNHLLKAYIQTDDVKGASGLWNRLQEDGLRVSDSFLYELGQYLKGNDIEPPFAVPPEPVNEESTFEKTPKTRVSRKAREANEESGVAPAPTSSSEPVEKQESTSEEETPKTRASRKEEEAKVKTPVGKSVLKKQFSQALASGNLEDVLKFKEK